MSRPDVVLYTPDHPEAAGRQPQQGEVSYRLWFPLDDGRTLFIHMGREGWNTIRELIGKIEADEKP